MVGLPVTRYETRAAFKTFFHDPRGEAAASQVGFSRTLDPNYDYGPLKIPQDVSHVVNA